MSPTGRLPTPPQDPERVEKKVEAPLLPKVDYHELETRTAAHLHRKLKREPTVGEIDQELARLYRPPPFVSRVPDVCPCCGCTDCDQFDEDE